MPVKDYNADPDLNTQISGINIAEGCAPSGINNAIRQLMADVKEESEAQAQAVGEAKDEADSKVSSLETALRSLIAQEGAKCLKLTGGTLTDSLRVPNILRGQKDGTLGIYGGDAWREGAYMEISGPNAEYPDVFTLHCAGADIVGDRDGVAVGGHPILTSAGGTMTGSLFVSNILSGNNDGFGLYGGDEWRTGGYIELGGPNHTYPNYIQITGGSRQTLDDMGTGWRIDGSPIVTLTSSWRSGNDWYRKYSDGWVEQGGRCSGTWAGFHVPFSTTYYTATVVAEINNSGNEAYATYIKSKGTTGMSLWGSKVLNTNITNSECNHTSMWYACGY